MLMYNNSVSPMLLICNPSHNIISLMDLSNNSLSLNDHGIYWETPVILQVWYYFGHSWLAHQINDLYPFPWHYYICRPSMSVYSSCVPSHITSNRGSEFVSNFFCSLGTALDMWLHFTSGYHPEGDRQTKCTNQTLEQYLHVYCNYQQDN